MEIALSRQALVKCVELACLYMMRPNCKVRDKLGNKLFENIQALHLPEAFEDQMLANVIMAMGSGPTRREELLGGVLDLLEYCEASPEERERILQDCVEEAVMGPLEQGVGEMRTWGISSKEEE